MDSAHDLLQNNNKEKNKTESLHSLKLMSTYIYTHICLCVYIFNSSI